MVSSSLVVAVAACVTGAVAKLAKPALWSNLNFAADTLGTLPKTIEREIPQDPVRQKADIGHAVNLLNRLKREVL